VSRRLYKWDEQSKQLVELSADWEPTPRTELMTGGHYDGLQASDGSAIDTAKRHREYMRRNNLALAQDFQGEWKKAEAQRTEYRQGRAKDPARREAVARAVYRRFKP
jgi:hypothetical protein